MEKYSALRGSRSNRFAHSTAGSRIISARSARISLRSTVAEGFAVPSLSPRRCWATHSNVVADPLVTMTRSTCCLRMCASGAGRISGDHHGQCCCGGHCRHDVCAHRGQCESARGRQSAYVGSQGRNLFLRNWTHKITQVLANGSVIRQFDIVQSDGTILGPYAEIDYKTSGGWDSYNAAQLSLARRFSTGLTLNTQYTLSASDQRYFILPWRVQRLVLCGSNSARFSLRLA
jgi:hypothetical protein